MDAQSWNIIIIAVLIIAGFIWYWMYMASKMKKQNFAIPAEIKNEFNEAEARLKASDGRKSGEYILFELAKPHFRGSIEGEPVLMPDEKRPLILSDERGLEENNGRQEENRTIRDSSQGFSQRGNGKVVTGQLQQSPERKNLGQRNAVQGQQPRQSAVVKPKAGYGPVRSQKDQNSSKSGGAALRFTPIE